MLIRKARRLRITKLADARGRCFALSLEVAALASRLGLDLQLIVWRVVGDPDFVEHWAVALDGSRVIDPTRVQVDGLTDLVCPIRSYPKNYVRPRVYPSALLLRGCDVSRSDTDGRFFAEFLWAARWRLFGYDVRRHFRLKRLQGSAEVVTSMLRFCATAPIAKIQSRLETRKTLLVLRIGQQVQSHP